MRQKLYQGDVTAHALNITLYAAQPATLPLSYNPLLQGAFYSCWRDTVPQLHDSGFTGGGSQQFRMFTFSQIQGDSKVDKNAKTITFTGPLHVEFRSPAEQLVSYVVDALAAQGSMRLGSHILPIVNAEERERLIFPRRAVIRMVSPITLHRTLVDGHTEFIGPDSSEFAEALLVNTTHKAEAFDVASRNIQAICLGETLRKRVIQFKGTYISGWTGDLIVSAEPELMRFLYYSGIGDRNSQGFGMFDIVEKPL